MKASRPHRTLFVDTDILLHFTMFDELDWRDIAQAGEVLLVVSLAVTKNLDKLKFAHPQKKLRDRARTVVNKLARYESQAPTPEIRPQVRIEFLHTESLIDFGSAQLRPEVDDDWLIASILAYGHDHPDRAPELVTADLALTLKAKHRQIGVLTLPDSRRLVDEPDPYELRVKELELQKRELEAALPSLQVTFPDGSSHFQAKLSVVPAERIDIDAEMRRVAAEHPKVSPSAKKARTRRSDIQFPPESHEARMMQVIAEFPVEMINKSIDTFLESFRLYLELRQGFLVAAPRTQPISLVLHNEGGAPADDVDVYLHFPEDHLLGNTPPAEPKPPTAPWNPYAPTSPSNWPSLGWPTYPGEQSGRLASINSPGRQSIRGPFIDLAETRRARFQIDRLKHGFVVDLPTLYVTVPPSSNRSALHLSYRIYCGSNPRQESGFLDLVIEVDTID